MSTRRIYWVDICHEVCVLAENMQSAEAAARSNLRDIQSNEEPVINASCRIATVESLPEEWRDAIPYRDCALQSGEEDLDCTEWIMRGAGPT